MNQDTMDKITIKLETILDIITNSSTETFTVVDKEAVKTIKNLVNYLLDGVGAKERFNDFFEIHTYVDRIEEVDYPPYDKTVRVYDEPHDRYSDPYNQLVEVRLKDGLENEKLDKVAEIMSNLHDLFDTQEVYC